MTDKLTKQAEAEKLIREVLSDRGSAYDEAAVRQAARRITRALRLDTAQKIVAMHEKHAV